MERNKMKTNKINLTPTKLNFRGFACSIVLTACSVMASQTMAEEITTGVYTGKFGHGKATLFIDSIKNNKVTGRSLYLHNFRPLKGTLKNGVLTLKEPNTRTGDGVFQVEMYDGALDGMWRVFKKSDTKKGIAPKTFRMKKSSCTPISYEKDSFQYKLSHERLSSEDLMMPANELDYYRNSIFARHGYSFKSKGWASLFADDENYTPCYLSVTKTLNKIEKENIRRILAMTEYAKKNPDQFGR